MLEVLIGLPVLLVMGLFAYVGIHMSEEKRQGKSLPMFWEKEKDMGYGMGYSKKPAKKAKKKKKTAMKKKKKY